MPCEIKGNTIICSRPGRKPKGCYHCGAPTGLLCDRQLTGGRTCDRPVCTNHSRHTAYNVDICLEHLSDSHIGKGIG